MRRPFRPLSTLALLAPAALSIACSEDPNQGGADFDLEVSPEAIIELTVGEDAGSVDIISRFHYTSMSPMTAKAVVALSTSDPSIATVSAFHPDPGSFHGSAPCGVHATCYEPSSLDTGDLYVSCHAVGTATIEVQGDVRVVERGALTAEHEVPATASFQVRCVAKVGQGTGCEPPGTEAVGALGAALAGDATTLCSAITTEVDGEPTVHSSTSVASQPGAGDHTETFARLAKRVALDADAAASPILACGDHEGGTTFCLTDAPTAQGDHVVIANVLRAPLSLASAADHLTYGFVLDADNDASNNFVPHPAYPNDWYQGTDRWFEICHTPGVGWQMFATDASSSPIQPLASSARVVVQDNVIALIVPSSELAAQAPGYRVTSFRHQGDWGLEGLPWSGDVEPPVAAGLALPQ
jgi:hypothetical protein